MSTLLAIAGTAVTAASQFKAAKGAEMAGQYQEELGAARSKQAFDEGRERHSRMGTESRRKMGAMRARMAAGGTAISGSATDFLSESARRLQLQASDAFRSSYLDSQNEMQKGRMAKWEGQQQASASRARGFGTLLEGVSEYTSEKKMYKRIRIMPDLPNLNLNLAAPRQSAAPSLAGAQAGAQGMASVGKSLGRVGATMRKVQDFEDKGHIAATRTEMRAAQKRFAIHKMENPDQTGWGSFWEKEIGNVKKFYGGRQMLGENQARGDQVVAEWEQLSSLSVEEEQTAQSIGRANMAWQTNWGQAKDDRDFEGMREAVPELPHATPEQRDAAYAEIDQLEKTYRTKERVAGWRTAPGEQTAEVIEDIRGSDLPSYEKTYEIERAKRKGEVELNDALEGVAERALQDGFSTWEEVDAVMPKWGDVKTRQLFKKSWQARKDPTPYKERWKVQQVVDQLDAIYHGEDVVDEEAYLKVREQARRTLLPYALRDDMKDAWRAFERSTLENQRAIFANRLKAEEKNNADSMKRRMQIDTAILRSNFIKRDDWDTEKQAEFAVFKEMLPGLAEDYPDEGAKQLWSRWVGDNDASTVRGKPNARIGEVQGELEGSERGTDLLDAWENLKGRRSLLPDKGETPDEIIPAPADQTPTMFELPE